jgi:hypothetical protein
MESEVKYGDKTMTNSISHGKLKDEIHAKLLVTVYNCPNMNFIDPIFSVLGQLYTVTNNLA